MIQPTLLHFSYTSEQTNHVHFLTITIHQVMIVYGLSVNEYTVLGHHTLTVNILHVLI